MEETLLLLWVYIQTKNNAKKSNLSVFYIMSKNNNEKERILIILEIERKNWLEETIGMKMNIIRFHALFEYQELSFKYKMLVSDQTNSMLFGHPGTKKT